jgi:hypothetical protein
MGSKAFLPIVAVALSHSAMAGSVVFANGTVHVPLPERFTVSQRGERLIATFGEGGVHRLEMTLVRVLSKESPSYAGYYFVQDDSFSKSGVIVRSDRAIFMEHDRQVSSETFRTMHWQIGVDGCVLEMTFTAPRPMSQDLELALRFEFNTILNGVRCVVP